MGLYMTKKITFQNARCGILWKTLSLFIYFVILAKSQLITEIYETCTAFEGEQARCGPNANCLIMNGVPTCHCIVDSLSGIATAGNPYKACTWDISGTWQLFSYIDKESGFYREILNPTTNEPFVIRFDRTDAILKTRYMLGTIFIITALTSFSMGFCGRAFLDASDNTTIILEQSEGFVDQYGRSILLRTQLLDTTLIKLTKKFTDRYELKGKWQKSDGSPVEILEMKKPVLWPNKKHPTLTKKTYSYWYNDASYGAPLLRLSMGLFLDTTLDEEKAAFNSEARFVQVGWYGSLRYGSNRINIYSPADGKPIFTFLRIDTFPPIPPVGPLSLPSSTMIQQSNNTQNATTLADNFSLQNLTDMISGGISSGGFSPGSIVSGIFGLPDVTSQVTDSAQNVASNPISAAFNLFSGIGGIDGGGSDISGAISGISNIFSLQEDDYDISLQSMWDDHIY